MSDIQFEIHSKLIFPRFRRILSEVCAYFCQKAIFPEYKEVVFKEKELSQWNKILEVNDYFNNVPASVDFFFYMHRAFLNSMSQHHNKDEIGYLDEHYRHLVSKIIADKLYERFSENKFSLSLIRNVLMDIKLEEDIYPTISRYCYLMNEGVLGKK